MNDEQQLDQNIQQDVIWAKKDLNTLTEDGNNKVTSKKISEDLTQTTEDVATWVNSGVALLSSEFEKVKADATKTVTHASQTVKMNVGNGLSQYNAKVTEVAKKLPGGVAIKAGKYPWVAVTFALMVGFLLRSFMMPRRHFIVNSNQPGCTQNLG